MIELAKLDNGELIYGTYEECEAYADKVDSWVIKYMDHVNPSTVYKNFKYVEFDSPLKYNEIDSKCPFILYNKVWIIELKVSDLSNQEKEIYNLHKKVKHKKMPWWKNEI